jgi:protein-S-isoprenylcysteine O-methyltransferase Ste14
MYLKSQTRLHENRPDLAGEHRFTDSGQIILFVIFLAVWISDSYIFKFSTFLTDYARWYFRVVPGILILVLGFYMSWKGISIVFGEKRDPPQVITKSVFSVVRHPVYLGSILSILGLVITTLSILSFIIWLIFVIFYIYVSLHEEKLLISKFGKEYEEYMRKVPMLFPVNFRYTTWK